MNPIILAIIIVAGIGLVIGIILAFASVVMAVPKDEKAEAVLEALPGANCGACGFSGCSGYAEALAHGKAKNGLCSPGGEDTVLAVSEVLGIAAEGLVKQTALVNCCGTSHVTERLMDYDGVRTCAAASQLFGGTGDCAYGCMGFGDCKNACEYGAVEMINGIAAVNPNKCVACMACVKACPKNLISIVPQKAQAAVLCSNFDKGNLTMKACKGGCIACMRCVKACEFDAVRVKNFKATVDPEKCTACGKCIDQCKPGCIVMAFEGIIVN